MKKICNITVGLCLLVGLSLHLPFVSSANADEPAVAKSPVVVQALVPTDDWMQCIVRLTGDAIGQAAPASLHETTSVRDLLMGTNVFGTATTSANRSITLVPHQSAAAFELVYTGSTVAKTTGYNGPAVIQSTTETKFTIHKLIVLDEKGVRTLPSRIEAKTTTRIDHVGGRKGAFRSRLVGIVARPRVNRDLPTADRITNERTSARIVKHWDYEVDRQVAALDNMLTVQQIARNGFSAIPLTMQISTTPNYVQVVMHPGEKCVQPTLMPAHMSSPLEVCLLGNGLSTSIGKVITDLETTRTLAMAILQSRGMPIGAVSMLGINAFETSQQMPLFVREQHPWVIISVGKNQRPELNQPQRLLLTSAVNE